MRAAAVLAATLAAVAVLTGCAVTQEGQDLVDQRHLRRHLGIPGDFELVSYDGFPITVGFGQREGLNLTAVYALTDEQEVAFIADAMERGWQRLPMPAGDRDKMGRLSGDVPLDDVRGIYLARTVGNEVLRSRSSRPLSEVARPNDLILGVLDTDTNRLYARVASGY
jgi:hypothetical protein